jgi:hypothetical protein
MMMGVPLHDCAALTADTEAADADELSLEELQTVKPAVTSKLVSTIASNMRNLDLFT